MCRKRRRHRRERTLVHLQMIPHWRHKTVLAMRLGPERRPGERANSAASSTLVPASTGSACSVVHTSPCIEAGHIAFGRFRDPSLLEAGDSSRRDEVPCTGEFGETEGRRAAGPAVDPRQFATWTRVTVDWRTTARERVGFAGMAQLLWRSWFQVMTRPDSARRIDGPRTRVRSRRPRRRWTFRRAATGTGTPAARWRLSALKPFVHGVSQHLGPRVSSTSNMSSRASSGVLR